MDFKAKENLKRIEFFLGRMAKGKIVPFIPKPPPAKVQAVINKHKVKKAKKNKDIVAVSYIPPFTWDADLHPDRSKPLSNGYSFGAWLLKRGFKKLGNGAYSTIYAKDGQDRVIKVTAGSQDNWIDYIQWSASKGYCGSFAPRVYSWKKLPGRGGGSSEFSVSVVERLTSTICDAPKHDFRLVETLLYHAMTGHLLSQVYLDDMIPGSVEFFKDFKSQFPRGNDLYGKNMMIRSNGTFCLTDPVCGESTLKINRLRSADFTSVAPALRKFIFESYYRH